MKTAVQLAIEYVEQYSILSNEMMIAKLTELLEVEREQIRNSRRVLFAEAVSYINIKLKENIGMLDTSHPKMMHIDDVIRDIRAIADFNEFISKIDATELLHHHIQK